MFCFEVTEDVSHRAHFIEQQVDFRRLIVVLLLLTIVDDRVEIVAIIIAIILGARVMVRCVFAAILIDGSRVEIRDRILVVQVQDVVAILDLVSGLFFLFFLAV